jgi:hypothetical protein
MAESLGRLKTLTVPFINTKLTTDLEAETPKSPSTVGEFVELYMTAVANLFISSGFVEICHYKMVTWPYTWKYAAHCGCCTLIAQYVHHIVQYFI